MLRKNLEDKKAMKEALKRIVDNFHKYNSEHMAAQTFGLSEDILYLQETP